MTVTAATNNTIKTYRHEFSKEFMADLSRFSKVHQFDDRHTYKSEWMKWAQQENIAEAIEIEKRRLEENGYNGDIEDKMFKAGRYYFRKKSAAATAAAAHDEQSVPTLTATATATQSVPDLPTHTAAPGLSSEAGAVNGRTPPQHRRTYITMSKACIKMMDEHIHNASTAGSNIEFKPSSCYSDFYKNKMSSDEMTKEIEFVIEKYEKTPGAMSNITPEELTEQIMDKIKKTYKNRYYKYTSTAH
jgi:Tfp pilus assembly protein PilW